MVIYLPKQILVDALPSYAMTLLPLISITAMMPSTFITAYWSDKIGQIPILIVGYLSSFALAYPVLLFTTTSTTLWPIVIVHVLFAWSLGACFGPRSSLITRMFPVSHRYTGVSLTYNIANAAFGGLSPIICATIANSYGPSSPALWIIVCALISFLSVIQLVKAPKENQKY
ncbi:hypothetical protein ID47_03930 [Candidatus Paracaedibacter acanthamoebae]|uniref:Major facilitator superfamily (MFS) profile domain-containing protein n=1 Tax=Candidatus Odyssella acanthamoebae TaxID=91604 RepID=A0A077AWQ7_9PROT|nr:MFS transporter [Candidatus Paracaedibacter acanthamoebae]AIK96078.1 hypothetical protein ID47_03930 [Candidatus Paracaedibacter acanthamoebae]